MESNNFEKKANDFLATPKKSEVSSPGKKVGSVKDKKLSGSSFCCNSIIDDYKQYLEQSKAYFEARFATDVFSSTSSLDKYEIIRTIGTGTFGHVALARCKGGNEERYVALKIMPKEVIVKRNAVKYVVNEKRVLQSINFPFCVFLLHSFKDCNYIYLSMPFINGGELTFHLKKLGTFDERTSSFYAAQLVLCIEYLHFLQLVYRDLKPENVLIDSAGYIRLTDFGFCKRINGRAYSFCGTPEYIAPEIILNHGYGQTVDWWSLGVVIFEMNAGYTPFHSENPLKMYADITSGRYAVQSHFSEELTSLISRLLEKDPTRRFGALEKGVDDIKSHAWFRQTDWMRILNKTEVPPILPVVNSVFDCSYFETYEEPVLAKDFEDPYELLFSQF